ncbi:MAG TPA: YbfB/YjiJ family MFS transporter, partial [Burkholderiaceae bacterium]|nr:YbfB/YjiJ family MFS transporter [Burkholderiaceae bacterium]
MDAEHSRQSPLLVAVVGLLGLAAAMGIGRFAFTPMLPLMQAQHGLSISDGGWLAGANYLGYLLGGLSLLLRPPRPAIAARIGLLAVAACTLPMAFTTSFESWWLLRLLAGVASAWVLVGVSGWALPRLAAAGRPALSGWVFAGVGIGIVAAGMVGLVIGHSGQRSAHGWLVLGVLAMVVAILGWRAFDAPAANAPGSAPAGTGPPGAGPPGAGSPEARSPGAGPPGSVLAIPDALRITLCYGAFGFGYIIPATFLPAQARQVIADPLVFGWVWPVFGVAAA